MLAFFHRISNWLISLFWNEEIEVTLVGLQMSGKTTFINVISVSRSSVSLRQIVTKMAEW